MNVCDDLPAEPAQVQQHAAELLGLSLPQSRPYADALDSMSAMARSFWAEHRRVSNRLLCEELGYQLLHPDFRSGIRDCWEQENLNPQGGPAARAA